MERRLHRAQHAFRGQDRQHASAAVPETRDAVAPPLHDAQLGLAGRRVTTRNRLRTSKVEPLQEKIPDVGVRERLRLRSKRVADSDSATEPPFQRPAAFSDTCPSPFCVLTTSPSLLPPMQSERFLRHHRGTVPVAAREFLRQHRGQSPVAAMNAGGGRYFAGSGMREDLRQAAWGQSQLSASSRVRECERTCGRRHGDSPS